MINNQVQARAKWNGEGNGLLGHEKKKKVRFLIHQEGTTKIQT
jgi:hypothetical protein